MVNFNYLLRVFEKNNGTTTMTTSSSGDNWKNSISNNNSG